MNHREIFIDLTTTVKGRSWWEYEYGEKAIVFPPIVEYVFEVSITDNEIQWLSFEYKAEVSGSFYTSDDLGKEICENILRQIESGPASRSISSEGSKTHFDKSRPHTIEVRFSERAKELFDELIKYKPKLLEQFSNVNP